MAKVGGEQENEPQAQESSWEQAQTQESLWEALWEETSGPDHGMCWRESEQTRKGGLIDQKRKKKHSLKVESYVLLGAPNWELKPGMQPLW